MYGIATATELLNDNAPPTSRWTSSLMSSWYAQHLTGRQREVLQMLAEGRSAKEIAYTLQVSVRTVHFHNYSIMEQLGIKTNSKLVQYAIKHPIISPP